MKTRKSFFFFKVGLLAWLLGTSVILGGAETVTVSPDNLDEDVKFYSECAAQMHTLTVQAASGFKFKSGPSLSLNPESLWTATGGNSFSMINMEDRTEITAKVDGVLVPDGGGGGSGTPPEYPFVITMISRYFTMDFIEPTEETEFIKEEDIPVSVFLLNAVGAPATGSINFSSTLGNFGLNNPVTVQSGLAEGILTVSADGGTKGKIIASASEIDITDNKTASGEKESKEFTAWELKLDSLFANPDSATEQVSHDTATGTVILFIRQEVFGNVIVKPGNIPDEKVQIRIVQDVTSYRDWTYNSPPPGKTKQVRTTNGARAWDANYDQSNATRQRDGENLQLKFRDEPNHGSNDASTLGLK